MAYRGGYWAELELVSEVWIILFFFPTIKKFLKFSILANANISSFATRVHTPNRSSLRSV